MFNKKEKNQGFSKFAFFPKNQKAQIGETMTWVVATIIIIVLLGISLFVVSMSVKDRKFSVESYNDLFVAKSVSGYLLSSADGEKVYQKLIEKSEEGKNYPLEGEDIVFFESIFNEIYREEYPSTICAVLLDDEDKLNRGICQSRAVNLVVSLKEGDIVREIVNLTDKKSFQIVLVKEF